MKIINRKKKQLLTRAILGFLAVSFCTSCVDRFDQLEKYQRPEWLAGKIYTQISDQENMTIFSQFLTDTGYDKIVNKTGTYAAFVPTDSVMKIYLMDKYGTSNPSEIDSSVKANIVKYHILPMPWSKAQLQSLSARGWISMTDISNNEPTAFKRKTLLREPNKTYNVQRFLGSNPFEIIVPNNSSTKYTVYNNSPKYVPLFFDGFMNAKGLSTADYSFYFNRPYEAGEIYYANAKMIGDEIFAENGFVYTVDKVVEPLKNAEQILETGKYATFLQLIHNNSVFEYNQSATQAQEGADQGAEVDKLYDLSYPSLDIDIQDEIVSTYTYTVERNNGLLAPTDEAMAVFFNDYLKAWGSNWNAVPKGIQRAVVKAHIAFEPVYKKNITSGFYNYNGDIVDESDISIDNASYGSNTTFIGLKKVIVPKFFSSVSAPLYLDPSYSFFFGSYRETGLLSALKDPAVDYSLFLVDNASLAADSSLLVTELTNGRSEILAFDRGELKNVNMLSSSYRDIFKRKLYGQIGVQPILGQAKREFIETLDGRHIVVQNDTVSGGAPSVYGFNGDSTVTVVFSEITNFTIPKGHVYKSNGWLKFPTTSTYQRLAGTKFLALLNKVKLADTSNSRLIFPDETERYTIFVPSDAALNSIGADNLSLVELKKLLSFHIVKGKLIFTDGRQPKGTYRTLDNQFINLDPQPDNLMILDKNQNVLWNQLLSPKSNLIGMYLQNSSENYFLSNTVVHRIDTVIMPY